MSVNFLGISSIFLQFGKFHGHLVYFMVTWVYFFPFWYFAPRKIWQPWLGREVGGLMLYEKKISSLKSYSK
jgi:hypothetical protein